MQGHPGIIDMDIYPPKPSYLDNSIQPIFTCPFSSSLYKIYAPKFIDFSVRPVRLIIACSWTFFGNRVVFAKRSCFPFWKECYCSLVYLSNACFSLTHFYTDYWDLSRLSGDLHIYLRLTCHIHFANSRVSRINYWWRSKQIK